MNYTDWVCIYHNMLYTPALISNAMALTIIIIGMHFKTCRCPLYFRQTVIDACLSYPTLSLTRYTYRYLHPMIIMTIENAFSSSVVDEMLPNPTLVMHDSV